MTSQAEFSRALFDPGASVPDGLIRPDGTPAGKRFDVYRNNVVLSLIEALGAAYPMVKARVGEEFFIAMAGRYVRQFPPDTPLMIYYGAEFPGFLEGLEPVRQLPWLPDLARLERARREVFHAADAAPDGLSDLAGLGPEDLARARLRLLPSMRLVRSDWPVLSLWRALDQGAELPDGAGEDVLIARPEMELEMRLLPAGVAGFLETLASGVSLGDAAEMAADNPKFDLNRAIGGLFEARLVASIVLEDSP